MFLYYAKALALGMLTLSISCSLYSTEVSSEFPSEEEPKQPKGKPSTSASEETSTSTSSGLHFSLSSEEESKQPIGKPSTSTSEEETPSSFLGAESEEPLMRKEKAQSFATQGPFAGVSFSSSQPIKPSSPKAPGVTAPGKPLMKGPATTPKTSAKPGNQAHEVGIVVTTINNEPSILFMNKKGEYSWTPFEKKDKTLMENIREHYPNTDFSKAKEEETTVGNSVWELSIAPVSFVPADSFNTENADFKWIPLKRFLISTTLVSEPIAQKGPTGKPLLASVAYHLQQAIKALGSKISAAAAQPLPNKPIATRESVQVAENEPEVFFRDPQGGIHGYLKMRSSNGGIEAYSSNKKWKKIPADWKQVSMF